MTVRELKELLSQYPDDMQILISADPEGNAFSYLHDYGVHKFVPDGYYIEEIYVMDEFIGTNGYTEEDRAPEGAETVLVLWP